MYLGVYKCINEWMKISRVKNEPKIIKWFFLKWESCKKLFIVNYTALYVSKQIDNWWAEAKDDEIIE